MEVDGGGGGGEGEILTSYRLAAAAEIGNERQGRW